jgi:class 3 adenylate cyclase
VPDAPPEAAPTNKAIVFTDIEASTRLLRSLGPRFDPLLARHHALIRRAIEAHRGVEVSTEGDAFFVLFDRTSDALEACIEAQRLLAAEPWPSDGVVRVRMGIHHGDVRAGGDNVIGLGVHQAARVAPAAHGGQVILSGAAANALFGALPEQVDLLDLGAYHLRDFDEPQHLFQVLHPDLEHLFPPVRATAAVVHNLAPPRTSFVGREAEVEELTKAIDAAPLVTLVGPGGVGKTRLASEVGLSTASRYPNGVWFVSLARANDSSDVAEFVKAAMNLADDPGRTASELITDRLASAPALLILDDCEHVLDGCVELAEALLDASESLRLLATSREHLGVMGEVVVRLDALALPGEGNDPVQSAAVRRSRRAPRKRAEA